MSIWLSTIRYDTIRYDTIRYDTIRYDTIRLAGWSIAYWLIRLLSNLRSVGRSIRYHTLRFDTIRYKWYDTIRHNTIWYDTLIGWSIAHRLIWPTFHLRSFNRLIRLDMIRYNMILFDPIRCVGWFIDRSSADSINYNLRSLGRLVDTI
jgi:hypothetical protein